MSESKDGWMFWLTRTDMVERVAARFALDAGLDLDDFRQELMLTLVRRHPSYQPRQTKPITWAWWQARGVRKKLFTQNARHPVGTSEDCALVGERLLDNGVGERSIEAVASVAMIKSIATDDEWAAATSRAAGFSENEIRDSLGCAPFTARRRCNALANRLEVSHGR